MTAVSTNSLRSEIIATLHPFVKPGSMPSIFLPLIGCNSSNCFKFLANTSIAAFSASLVSDDRIWREISGVTAWIKIWSEHEITIELRQFQRNIYIFWTKLPPAHYSIDRLFHSISGHYRRTLIECICKFQIELVVESALLLSNTKTGEIQWFPYFNFAIRCVRNYL